MLLRQTQMAIPKPNSNIMASTKASLPRPITSVISRRTDMNRNQEVGFFGDSNFYSPEDPLEINMRNLENLSLLDNLNAVHGMTGLENNENIAFFQDYDATCNNPSAFLGENDDSKEPNVSRTVRVPTSEHVAEIVGRQGCKIKDLRARTNTYIKTPMRTEAPIFVVTGKETAVNLVIAEINSAAEHFTQIRASRNHHKNGGGGGGEVAKPVSREGDVVLHVTVPYRVVGLVVGLKGQTIKQIQQDTDTFIVTPNRDKAPIFEIRGQPSNVERARLMIERHIEMRTRNCRLQDTTNLQSSWNGSSNEDSRFGGNDLHYYYSDTTSPQNGNNNNNNSNNTSNNYSSVNGNNGYNNSSLHSPNYSNYSQSSTAPGNYNTWRGYSGMMDSSSSDHSTPVQTWSNATSDYNGVMGNGHSSNLRNGNSALQYTMSLGTLSSNSNDSGSLSPPQQEFNSGSFNNGRSMPAPVGGSSSRRISDPSCENSSFPSYPLFSSASSSTCPKGSLVLGNILQSNCAVSPSMVNNGSSLSNRDLNINGFGRNGDGVGFTTPPTSDFCAFRSAITSGESSTGIFGPMSTTDMSGFPSGDSSPSSKSCSVSETSGSQGSPTPRMCKVCEEADVVAALVPCGHNHFCMECAEGIINKLTETDRKCPICNTAAADVLRILA